MINPNYKNPYMENEKALVSVVGGKDVKSMVKEAVSLIGGLERINIRGKTVLIKPNVVTGNSHPTTTNPEVVRATGKVLYEAGAKKVIVGDMSAFLTLSTARNMKRTGITRAAMDAGVEVVCFEDYNWTEVQLPGAKYIRKVSVTEWIYKVDIIINLPVIKTHKYATYSICLKNFIGATHLKQRPYFIDSSHWEEIISEINLAYTPHLNIIDGTVSMIKGGPRKGTPASTNVILASGDRIAGDAAGLGVIKGFGVWPKVANRNIWEQRQIKRALELGIGTGKGRVDIRETALAGHNADFKELVHKMKTHIGC